MSSLCGAEDWTQGFMHAGKSSANWAISPGLNIDNYKTGEWYNIRYEV